MSTAELKREIKKYIDRADEKTLKIVYAMLEAEEDYNSWKDMPDGLRKAINKSLKQADEGKRIPHDEAKKVMRNGFQNN